MSIIQQLEDLKEWAQNPERYERRLAFRGNLPSTEAGTIPIEWDELSDREQEYYRTGPWSTREDYSKGQLVQPGPGRQGYAGVKIGKTELKQLRKAGLEVSEIAGKFGVSVKTINNRLKEYDLLGTFKRVKPMSKRQAAQISKTLPQGVNITWDTSGGKAKGWRVSARFKKNNKLVFNKSYLNPEPKLIKQLVKEYETQYKKYYPNALSDAEFKKLRFQKKNINLTSDEFANVLNEKGYKSYKYDESFTKKQVHNIQKKLDISDEVGKQIKPLTKSQQKTLINAFPEYAGQWDFKADKYGLNFSEVGGDVWSMLRSTADDTKRWPTGGTAKSRLWHNAYRAALKGGDSGRFRILHPIDGEIMSRDEILKYNWTKGSSNVEFLDTLTDKKFNYDGFEKWMNNDAVPGQADANRFKNAANQYDLNKKLKQIKVGDTTFGNLLNEKFKGKASKQLRFSGLINHHLHDIADNFWDTDIVFFKDNTGVARFEKSARDALKTAATLPEAEQTKFLKSFTNKFKGLGPIRLVEGEMTLGAYNQGDMLKNVANQLNLGKKQTIDFSKGFKDLLRNNYVGAAELTYGVLDKAKFKKKICKTKFSNGGGGLCGKAFKNQYPQEYLLEVARTPGTEEILKSEEGLKLGRSILNNAKKIRASKTGAKIASVGARLYTWSNPLSLIGGELWYSWLAGRNEWTKGASLFESINEGLWFIPGKESRDIESLLGPDLTRREDGRRGKVIPDAMRENYYKLIQLGHIMNKDEELRSKLMSQEQGVVDQEEKIKNMQMKARHVDRDALGRPMENKLNLMQEDLDTLKFLANPEVEGSIADQLIKNTAKGDEQYAALMEADPEFASVGKLKDKIKDRIVDKFHKKRTWGSADPYSGEEWNWMKRNLWERPAGALDMSDQALVHRQKRLDEITKDSPNWKELERFWEQETGGKGLTIYDKQNLPPELIENFLVKYPWANYLFQDQSSRQEQAGGGIATLHPRRPKALPPTSGPDSQGLAYLNNYATKRTE